MKKWILILLLLSACTITHQEKISEVAKEKNQEMLDKVQNATPILEKKINETIILTKTVTTKLETEEKRIETTPTTIVGIGDSLTYGHNSNISWIQIYANNTKLYNYAVSGATTYSARYYQLELFQKENIQGNKLVFLWIGANDIVQRTPIADLDENYRYIVNTITNMPNTTLIIMNIPDASKLNIANSYQTQADEYLAQYGISIDVKDLARQVLVQYNKLIQNIANEYDIQVIDMFNFMENFDDSIITADHFHPNEKGHELIAEKVKFIILK